MALISTVGGTSSDSFVVDVAEATTLCDLLDAMPSLGVSTTAFRAASPTVKEALLKQAAAGFVRLSLVGWKVSPDQALEFPRNGLTRTQDIGVIPDAVKLAQVAEACSLSSPQSTHAANANAGIQSYSIGEESTTYAAGSTSRASGFSSAGEDILSRHGLVGSSAAGSVYDARG